MATPPVPIMTTPRLDDAPTPQTIMTVLLWTIVLRPDAGSPPERQQAYQGEQQARARAVQADTKHRATQWRCPLVGKQSTIAAQSTEPCHREPVLWVERVLMVDLTAA
jgi:hypothetical protein